MQGRGGGRDAFFDFGDPFAGFGGFGSFGGQRSLLSGFFGGQDPFGDPFFTRPFGSMFQSSFVGSNGSPFTDMPTSGFIEHQVPQPNKLKGPIIEELNSDDEKEEGTKGTKENPRKHARLSKEPYVEDPDDEAEGRKSKHLQYRNELNLVNNTQPQPQARSFTFQSSSVTYGGANGAYYTSSRTRRTGSDGLTIEECKEADTAAREASHRISRGIHNKGHSVTRKLKSDGKVDTMQTLHNLNEDELTGFEEAWKGNARKHLPGWSERFGDHDNMGFGSNGQNGQPSQRGWALPSTQHSGSTKPDMGNRTSSSQHSGWTKASRKR
ncbi:hypothetical protein L1049_006825 [Liquidambar formosana]|uniref:Myeloid leukemia factor 1 n=1 Tax=Liquidambar formosana TaxID=63359 RepID=A0AAP0WUN5_LIQFO